MTTERAGWSASACIAIGSTFLMAVLFTLASCGASQSLNQHTYPVREADVTFAQGTSYATALREMTDLGLQVYGYPPCGGDGTAYVGPDGTVYRGPYWIPVGEQDGFMSHSSLSVRPTSLAAPNWADLRNGSKDIVGANIHGELSCPFQPTQGTPAPGTPLLLSDTQVGTYLRAEFTSTSSYDAALSEISDLGLRLADPCAEQARKGSGPYTWRSPGQETSFSTTHTLSLATTMITSAIWRKQLTALADVHAVIAPFQAQCS